jgi:hypothetical protein
MSVEALRRALREHGGTIATVVTDQPGADDAPGPPPAAAGGSRIADDRRGEYELLLEMIVEGSLLHYGMPRAVAVDDPDLALLLGDQLYALGLRRLAELGDLEAVGELADVISLLAQARADGDAELAAAVWEAGAAAIGEGPTSGHEAAKALARRGDRTARAALLQSAVRDLANPQ